MQPGLPSCSPFCFGSSSATRQSWRSRPAVRSTALQPVDAPDDVTAAEMEAFMDHIQPSLYQPPDDSDIAHEFTAWLAARRETLRTAAGAGRPRDSQADVAAPDAAGGEESPDNETGRATPPAPAPAAASGRRRRRKPLAGGGGEKENADVEMDALMVERPRPAQTEQRWRAVLAARHEDYDRELEKDNPERPWHRVPHFQGDVEAECKLWARVVRALGEAYARHHWGIETIEFDPKRPGQAKTARATRHKRLREAAKRAESKAAAAAAATATPSPAAAAAAAAEASEGAAAEEELNAARRAQAEKTAARLFKQLEDGEEEGEGEAAREASARTLSIATDALLGVLDAADGGTVETKDAYQTADKPLGEGEATEAVEKDNITIAFNRTIVREVRRLLQTYGGDHRPPSMGAEMHYELAAMEGPYADPNAFSCDPDSLSTQQLDARLLLWYRQCLPKPPQWRADPKLKQQPWRGADGQELLLPQCWPSHWLTRARLLGARRGVALTLREADAEAHGEAPHAPQLVADAKFAFEVALREQQPAGALYESYRRLAAALAHSRRTRAGLALRHLALCPACSDALCFPAQHLPAVTRYTLPPVVQRAGCSDCDYLAMRRMLAARTSSYNECTAKDAAEWLRGLEQADAVKHAWGVVVVDAINRPPHAATRLAIMEGTFDHDSFAAFLRATPGVAVPYCGAHGPPRSAADDAPMPGAPPGAPMPGAPMTDAPIPGEPPAPAAAEDAPMPGGGQDAHRNGCACPGGCLGGPSFLPLDPCCECEE